MQNLILRLKNKAGWIQSLVSCVPQLAILSFLVAAAFLNSLAYIRNYTDDNAYHVPMAVEIARHGNPYYVDVDSAFTSFWFPAGAETIAAFLVFFIKDIRGTNLSGSIFFVLFLFLAYKFAGLWTTDLRVRLLCAVVTSLSPILLAETRAFYTDIHFNFFVYLSLYLYCLSLLSEDRNYSYLGIAAAILTASIKYHGVVVAAILLPVGIYCVIRNKKAGLRWWVMLILAICIAFTSGWYIRNLLLKGNPIYPLPLPRYLQGLLSSLGTPYQSIEDYPSFSPETRWPHPFIPETISHYKFQPDMTDDAFGIVFPFSLVMIAIVSIQASKMPKAQYQVFVFMAVTTVAIIAVMPFGLRVPRYVLFVPAVAALWPALMMGTTSHQSFARLFMYLMVTILGVSYIQANLLATSADKTIFQNAIALLREHRRSDIVYFDFVEKGDLKIGYLGGRFAFIASLYDQKLSNQLIQLHYQDYLYDKGSEYEDLDEFVMYVQSLKLDYICIFDDQVPGADILRRSFPEKTFVEDVFR
jgi:hypothetical protein